MDKTSAQQQTAIQNRILRIRDGAQAVLNRLDAGDRLSAVLSAAKVVFDEHGNERIHSYWIQFEIYGLGEVPLAKPPFKDADQRAAVLVFSELHMVEDSRRDSRAGSEPDAPMRSRPDRKVDPNSIGEMERSLEYWKNNEQSMISTASEASRLGDKSSGQQFLEWAGRVRVIQHVLRDVHSYLYDQMSRIRRWADVEIENAALLGPDYRIVLDSLDALRTDVRQELMAALENLTSPNPAAWSATALVCRNVVLALGRTLWPVKAESYESALAGKKLDLKGEREVNRLSAWIDHHWKKANEGGKTRLKSLDALARSIYKRGSKGKQQGQVRHEEGQKLVVDTFELVADLDRLVGLQPVVTP